MVVVGFGMEMFVDNLVAETGFPGEAVFAEQIENGLDIVGGDGAIEQVSFLEEFVEGEVALIIHK